MGVSKTSDVGPIPAVPAKHLNSYGYDRYNDLSGGRYNASHLLV